MNWATVRTLRLRLLCTHCAHLHHPAFVRPPPQKKNQCPLCKQTITEIRKGDEVFPIAQPEAPLVEMDVSHVFCEICETYDDSVDMLLCDGPHEDGGTCDRAYHL